ncbi:FlgO family outer membrane protein [Roseibium sp.]|uniref:FlgO family outer membrane protein n=1 Tax=Roseibium sp. TaxID=1936156 RepID=UPI003D14C6BD
MQNRERHRGAVLEVGLLGTVTITDSTGSAIALAGRKDRALVAYLAQHRGNPVDRDRLVGLIWPDASESSGRASLRQSLSTIRKALPEDAEAAIIANRESVCFDEALVTTDVRKLEDARGDPSRLDDLHLDLDGAVLGGLGRISADFDTWAASEASRLGVMATDVLSVAAEHAESEKRYADAVFYLSQALVIDPLAEDIVRRLMRLQAAAGRSEAALRQFRALEVLMETELGVRPDAQTQEVARSIRAARNRVPESDGKAPQNARPIVPGSVLVTRFVERSEVEDYFAVSFTESVILALSRFRETPVMDLKTVKAAGGLHDENATDMARGAGAEFVLSGTVQRSGDRLRVNARLTDTASGQTVWAEKFDTVSADLLDVEDELSARVATAIAGRIENETIRRARGKVPTDLAVIDWVMRGRYHLNLYTRSGEEEAKICFEEALKLDPECVPALAGLAVSHLHDFESASDLSDEKLELARELAQRAIDIDETNAHARYAMASAMCYLGGHELALQHCNRALETNPNDYHNICTRGWILTFSGDIEEGIACNSRAISLNPYAPNSCLLSSGFGLLVQGRIEEAIESLSAINAENIFKQGGLAAGYARLGLDREAKLAAKAFFTLAERDFPGDSARAFAHTKKYWHCLFSFAKEGDAKAFFTMLNEAGIPV